MSTITKDAFVSQNHKLSLDVELPASAPTGAVVITLTVKPRDADAVQTTSDSDSKLEQFMNSPLFGAWGEREDIVDPSEWVRSMRKPRDPDLPGAEGIR